MIYVICEVGGTVQAGNRRAKTAKTAKTAKAAAASPRRRPKLLHPSRAEPQPQPQQKPGTVCQARPGSGPSSRVTVPSMSPYGRSAA